MTNSTRGKFLVFEGLDGSGKTTQAALMASYLRSRNVPCYETREPTDGPIGSLIRQTLSGRLAVDPKTMTALFAADRLDHLQNGVDGVMRRISEGTAVVCDRYYFSSYAYHAAHVPLDWVIGMNTLSAELLRPDVTIFVDVTPEECVRRISLSRPQLHAHENLESLNAARDKYLEVFDRFRKVERVAVIPGDADPTTVAARVRSAISDLLPGAKQ